MPKPSPTFAAVCAGALAVGLLYGAVAPAAQAEEDPSSALGRAVSQARANVVAGIETVGPIPTVASADGDRWPTMPPGVAVMPRGTVLSGDLPLVYAGSLKGMESVDVRVRELSDPQPERAVVFQGVSRSGWFTVAKSLTAGSEYAVDSRDDRGDWQTVGTFNVSSTGDAGPVTSMASIAVSEVTGRASWSWTSPTLAGPAGGVGIGLRWESGSSTSVGLPEGWRLTASAGSPWMGLEESPVDVPAADVPAAPAASRDGSRITVDFAYPSAEARLVTRFVIEGSADSGAWRVLARPGRSFADADVDVMLRGRKASGISRLRVGAVVGGTTIWGPAARVRAQAAPITSAPVGRDLAGAASGSIATPGDLPSVVRLVGWNGNSLTFVRNALGVYQQTGGETPGFVNGLTWIRDGEWEFAALDGTVTRFIGGRAVSVTAKGMPVASMTWTADGRLSRLTNEIGRSLALHYSGDAACPAWSGFAAAPEGALCAVGYPGDRTSQIGYVGAGATAQISLIKDPGNVGETLGWDDRGRLVSVRAGIVNRVATVDPAASAVVSVLDYDAQGRAATLTTAPAAVGGPSAVKTIDFPNVTEAGLRAWVASGARKDAARITVSATGGGYELEREKLFDPITWQLLRVTAPYGLDASIQRDAATGQLTSAVDPIGRRTTYTYDELGQVTATAGPVSGGAQGSETTMNYDTERVDGRDRALSGLRAQVYDRDDYGGTVSAEFWEADYTRGGLSYSWSGRGSRFSAQASGVWTPPSADDVAGARNGWDFVVQASGGADVSFVIGGVLCARAAEVCHVDALPQGPKAVTVQIADAPAEGWFSVSAAPAGERPQPVAYRDLQPGFGLATVATSNDDLPGGTDVTRTEYSFADPSRGQVTSVKSLGGLVTDLAYEAGADGTDGWGRLVSRETPGGLVQETTYWPNRATVTLPVECGAESVDVSGQARTLTRQDGTSVTYYYDIHGQTRSVVSVGGAITHTMCARFGEDGSTLSSSTYVDGELVESATFEQAVGGDPRVARTTITHGAASPTSAGASRSSTATIDLHGRVVRSVGLSGQTTETTYDVVGNATRTVVTPPEGAGGSSQQFDYAFDRTSNLLVTVSVNGVVAADIARDPTNGVISSVDYAGAATVGHTYDPSGHLESLTMTTGNAAYSRIVDAVTRTSAGRITARSVDVTGSAAQSTDIGYVYDSAGRLDSAVYSGDVDARFAYEHGPRQAAACGSAYPGAGQDGQRTGGARNGVSYASCYDARGRQVSTTDPTVAGDDGVAELTHDGLGRVTRLSGPRALAAQWSAGTQLVKLDEISADGSGLVSTRWDSFGGEIVDKTVQTDSVSSTVRYAGVFILDIEEGAVAGTSAIRYSLPGGASVTTAPGASATLTLPGIDGSALVRVDVPALGSGGVAAPGGDPGLVSLAGPYGEPLTSPTTAAVSPVATLGWQASAGRETVAGSAAIVMMGDRPYHPALGAFLAADPLVDSGDNLYSYTSGDPVNFHDASGQEENGAMITLGVFTGVFLLGTFGSGYLMGKFAAQGRNFLAGKAKKFGYVGVALSAVGAGTTAYVAVKGQSSDVGIAVGAAVGAAAVAMVGGGLFAKWGYSRTTRLIEARLARERAAAAAAVAAEAVQQAKFEAIGLLAKGVAGGKIHPQVATAAARMVQGLPAATRAEVMAGFQEIRIHSRATSKAMFRAEMEAEAALKVSNPEAYWTSRLGVHAIEEVSETASIL